MEVICGIFQSISPKCIQYLVFIQVGISSIHNQPSKCFDCSLVVQINKVCQKSSTLFAMIPYGSKISSGKSLRLFVTITFAFALIAAAKT